jgi:hypothetical protein
MTSSDTNKKYRANKSLTRETVSDYFNRMCGNSSYPENLMGYETATRHLVKELNKILKSSKSFAELKGELTKYQLERSDFLDYLNQEFKWSVEKGDSPNP